MSNDPFNFYDITRSLGRIEGQLGNIIDDLSEMKELHKDAISKLDARITDNTKDIDKHSRTLSYQAGVFGAVGVVAGGAFSAGWQWLSNHIFGASV
jgi:hypothetical protein